MANQVISRIFFIGSNLHEEISKGKTFSFFYQVVQKPKKLVSCFFQ